MLDLRSAGELLSQLQAFRGLSPWEQKQNLAGITELCEALGRSSASVPLVRLARSSYRILNDYNHDPARHWHLFDLPERLACLSALLTHDKAVDWGGGKFFRKYLWSFEEPEGFPRAWAMKHDLQHAIEDEADAVLHFIVMMSLWRKSARESESRRRALLDRELLRVQAGTSFFSRKTWLTCLIHRTCDRIRLLLRYKALDCSAVDQCFVSASSVLLGGPSHEGCSRGSGLSVDIYGGYPGLPADDAIIHKMVEVCNQRVIDRSKHGPQLGFGRKITFEEIAELLYQSSAHLITVGVGGEPVGFYLLLTEEGMFPAHTQHALSLLKKKEALVRDRIGSLEYVVISHEGSQQLKSQGISSFGLVEWLASHLAALKQLAYLYLQCRSGPYANTAQGVYLRHGWHYAGLEITPGTLGSHTLDSCVVMRSNPYSLSRAVWYSFNQHTHDEGVFIYQPS